MPEITHQKAIRAIIDSVNSYAHGLTQEAQRLFDLDDYPEPLRKDIVEIIQLFNKYCMTYSPEKADKLSIELLNYKVPSDGPEQLRAAVKREQELVSVCLAFSKRSLEYTLDRVKRELRESYAKESYIKFVQRRLSNIESVVQQFDLTLPQLVL